MVSDFQKPFFYLIFAFAFATSVHDFQMNKITLHIEYLLRKHECVIVPGLGAFVAVMQPAVFDSDSSLFLPPLRRVMFNATINSDDGLLANSYSRHSGKKYEKARRELDNDIEQLQCSLAQTGMVRIGNVGTLMKNEEGNISFAPSLSPENVMSELGCSPVSCLAVKKQEERGDINTTVSDVRMVNRDKYYYIPVHKTFVKVAASMLAILAVAFAILVNPYRSSHRSVEASVMPIEKVLRLHTFGGRNVSESKNAVPVEVKATIASKDKLPVTAAGKTSAAVADSTVAPSGKYNLVVGAFGTEVEAERYASSSSSADYDLSVAKWGRHYLVVMASENDRKKIVELLNSQLVKNQYSGAWIWEKGEKN